MNPINIDDLSLIDLSKGDYTRQTLSFLVDELPHRKMFDYLPHDYFLVKLWYSLPLRTRNNLRDSYIINLYRNEIGGVENGRRIVSSLGEEEEYYIIKQDETYRTNFDNMDIRHVDIILRNDAAHLFRERYCQYVSDTNQFIRNILSYFISTATTKELQHTFVLDGVALQRLDSIVDSYYTIAEKKQRENGLLLRFLDENGEYTGYIDEAHDIVIIKAPLNQTSLYWQNVNNSLAKRVAAREEETFIILKPDAVEKGLLPFILSRLQQEGLVLSRLEQTTATVTQLRQHYRHLVDKPFFDELIDYMTRGPIYIGLLKGDMAVSKWRNLLGSTKPSEADPKSLRWTYGDRNGFENVAHGSSSKSEVEREKAIWFK